LKLFDIEGPSGFSEPCTKPVMSTLNYRHLHYFWVVAKDGSFSRAAERLDIAVQTVSAQVRELERSLGHQLLKPSPRGFSLTEAGEAAFASAEAIFQIGQQVPQQVRAAAQGGGVRLAVGLSDGLSKLAAHSLLAPVLGAPGLRLVCHEGEFDQLLAELALHHLDVVLAGQPAPPNPNLRLVSERLASAPVDWYGPTALVRAVRGKPFPQSLALLPVLLPTAHSALRAAIERWLDLQGLRVQLAGEFEDSALMAVFGARGLGVFPVSRLGADDVNLMRGVSLLGVAEGLHDDVHAIRSRRGLNNPLLKRLLEGAAP
jgi:LysR family transcriptional regulator, transcriptional activator of nhaA